MVCWCCRGRQLRESRCPISSVYKIQLTNDVPRSQRFFQSHFSFPAFSCHTIEIIIIGRLLYYSVDYEDMFYLLFYFSKYQILKHFVCVQLYVFININRLALNSKYQLLIQLPQDGISFSHPSGAKASNFQAPKEFNY